MRRHAWLLAWTACALLLLAALAVWQGRAYVSYSDGVYAESARLVRHGLVPYQDFAAAQPPGVYYLGALALAVSDSLAGLRVAMAAVDLVLALLTLIAVLRLTASRVAAGLAGPAVVVTPWALEGHAQLLPETFAAPLLLGAALAAAERRRAWLAGALGALAGMFKLAFLLPALGIVLACAAPWAALAGLAGTVLIALSGCLLGFGGAFWRGVVEAQQQAGTAGFHYVGGLWLQGAWNLAPLIALAAVGVALRHRARDPVAFRVVCASALGTLALVISLFKNGSYLGVLSVAEPPLLILSACALTWLWQRPDRRLLAICGLSAGWLAAEIVSLLATPTHPGLFGRPLAATSPGWTMTSSQVDARLKTIRNCRPGLPFSGRPYLAFVANRRMPGNQPDVFIIQTAAVNHPFLRRADRDRPRCPR